MRILPDLLTKNRRQWSLMFHWRRTAFSAIHTLVLACCLAGTVLSPAFTPSVASAGSLDFLFKDFTIKDEIELGRKFKILVKSRMPLVEDPEVVNYVRDIVARLQTNMPTQPYPFDVNVIRDNALNAFAVPGGYVFVHTGFILGIKHESELAGVLGHELAHLTERHIASRIEKAQQTQWLTMAGMLAGLLLGGSNDGKAAAVIGSAAAGHAAMLNYSRQDEKEADEMGLLYLINGGFQPQGMVGAFEAIRNARWKTGSRSVPQYLSTHPNVENRIVYLGDRVRGLPLEIRARPEVDDRFIRIQTLIRARYVDADIALSYFENNTKYVDGISLMGRAIALSRLNRIPEARDTFAAAMNFNPMDPLVIREAGRFEYTKGDRAKAIQLLQKALLLNPRDYMAMYFYARTLAEKGEVQRAADYYEQILLQLPEDAEIHYFYGRMLGENRLLFKAHLHMAYSALYRNNKKKVNFHRGKAVSFARTEAEKAVLEKFDRRLAERKEFWN